MGMADWNDRIIEEFRSNGGHVATMGFGSSLVLVHHVGAKSGAERVAPLFALRPAEGTWWIAASKAGAPQHPAWYHNLVAHPDTRIETPDGEVQVTARVLPDDERNAAWQKFTAASDAFVQYQAGTSRTIPVVELSRR